MRATLLCGLFLSLCTLSRPAVLEAAWEIRKIDADTSLSSTDLDGDLAAYEKDGDIYLYRISSGFWHPISQDLHDPTDSMIDLKGETGKWPYLKMKNPSIGCYHLECVAQECKTVQEAINFRASGLKNLMGKDWNPWILT